MITDYLLVVAVVAAVVVFGALISVGNERQRKAIDKLHTAYKQWAQHDLRIKRGVASANIEVNDTTAWLSKAASLAFGRKVTVRDFQIHNEPVKTIEFQDGETGETVVCALEAPSVLKEIMKQKSKAFKGELKTNPVFWVGKKTQHVEFSMLTAGSMFDLELPVVWERLFGDATETDILWGYTVQA